MNQELITAVETIKNLFYRDRIKIHKKQYALSLEETS